MADIDPSAQPALDPLRVTDPQRIAAGRYDDEEFFSLEADAVWGHAWQMACRLDTISHIGDWVEYTIIDRSAIVVRTQLGVTAYHNVCPHRDGQIIGGQTSGEAGSDHGNCAETGFICPFHGWRWNLLGENTLVTGRHMFHAEWLFQDNLRLRPVACETFGGEVYINFDGTAPPLRDWLGAMADAPFARDLAELSAAWWIATVLPANWKMAIEPFMAGEMTRGLLDADLSERPAPLWLAMVCDAITGDLRSQRVTVTDGVAVPRSHLVAPLQFLFPNHFIQAAVSVMTSYRIRPLAPESCLFEIWTFPHPQPGSERQVPTNPCVLPYDLGESPKRHEQDLARMPSEQPGMRAPWFEPMPRYSTRAGLVVGYHRILDAMIAKTPLESIARATALLTYSIRNSILGHAKI